MRLLVLSDLLETAADPRLVARIKEGLIVQLVKSLVVEVVLEVLQRKSELEHLGIWTDVRDVNDFDQFTQE